MLIKDIISRTWSKINDKINALTYADVGASSSTHTHAGSTIYPRIIELQVDSAGSPGWIDLHAGKDGNDRDYFARITTNNNGCLQFYLKGSVESDSSSNLRSLDIHNYDDTNDSWENFLVGRDYTTNESVAFYNSSVVSLKAMATRANNLVSNLLSNNTTNYWTANMYDGVYSTYSSTDYTWKDEGVPRTYCHILSMKHNTHLSQICITFDSLWYRTSSGTSWSGSSYTDSNGWTRLAVADSDGNVRGAVYN